MGILSSAYAEPLEHMLLLGAGSALVYCVLCYVLQLALLSSPGVCTFLAENRADGTSKKELALAAKAAAAGKPAPKRRRSFVMDEGACTAVAYSALCMGQKLIEVGALAPLWFSPPADVSRPAEQGAVLGVDKPFGRNPHVEFVLLWYGRCSRCRSCCRFCCRSCCCCCCCPC